MSEQAREILQAVNALGQVVTLYRQKVLMLEIEVLTMGNLLLENGLVTQEQLQNMQQTILERHSDADGIHASFDEVVQAQRGEMLQAESKQEFLSAQETLRAAVKEQVALSQQKADEERKRLKSARRPPTGHND